jgi:photosystem II stability/assembly factor-like uncharacterized protein
VTYIIGEIKMLRVAIIVCTLLTSIGGNTFSQDSDTSVAKAEPGLDASHVSAFRFRGIGPALMSGRIADIAVDPTDSSTWYIAAASGGVWKTTNAGTTWSPIFDNYGSYSIGCLAIDPNNRFTIWVGTGENNSQRSVGYGDGLYKSIDGGKSFEKVGLANSEHLGKIIVHPRNGNIVYVAAQGPLWSAGGDRGLYKTSDGGKSWEKILSVSENTGISDLVMDPENPNIMYASAYQRRRHVWTLINGGPESAIYKTTDAGKTWKILSRGLPGGEKGRIGLAISPHNPEVLYALVEAANDQSGFFRSADRGETWQKQSSYNSSSPQYYQEIVACPHKFDRVYSLDTYMQVSEDGGKTFSPLGEDDKHVDNHAMHIDPRDENHLLIGCDGGVYETWDRGNTYDFKANLPLTQFYKIAVSNDEPFYYVYGGTQDNATQGGPTQTINSHGIRNQDWFVTVFGDGFDPAVDPDDPDTIYSQWQYGGLVRYNRKTESRVDIKPQAAKGGEPLRFNWDSPLLISPHNSSRIYYAAQILFKSDDQGNTWQAISGDLSRNIDRNKLKVMGRVWGVDSVSKNASTSFYGNIVSLDESPLVEGLMYVGTDDGLVQVTEDGGKSWRKIETFGALDVPEFGYINDIEACLHDPDTVYVAINNHKRGDFKPYIVKSTDRGKTWTSISGNLPERGSVYTLKQDHVDGNLLFAGTEFGVFATNDGGVSWTQLKSGLPTIAVREIEIQRREDDLVLGTFGRGFYILDNYAPMRQMNESLDSNQAKIFPVKTGLMYAVSTPLGVGGKGFQGANYFIAPNPEFGSTFTVYMNENLQTQQSQRKANDAKLAREGKDVSYPSWDELKAEDREVSPRTVLTIRNADGEVVSRLRGPTSKGVSRINWNYRQSGIGPITLSGRDFGPYAIPGKYTVSMSKIVDHVETNIVQPVEFEVMPIGWEKISAVDRKNFMDFYKQMGKLQTAITAAQYAIEEAQQRIQYIKQAVEVSPKVDPKMRSEVRDAELLLMDINEALNGDPTKPRREEPGYPGLLERLNNAVRGSWSVMTGPTNTHRQNYEIAEQEFSELLPKIRQLVEKDVPELNKKLEAAGAKWTPGRKIPDWK